VILGGITPEVFGSKEHVIGRLAAGGETMRSRIRKGKRRSHMEYFAAGASHILWDASVSGRMHLANLHRIADCESRTRTARLTVGYDLGGGLG
jgi:ribosomal protein L32